MITKEIDYMAVLQFKEGQRFLKIFSVTSGQIRPAFYELLPRNERKNFKNEKFGDFDIVLKLDDNIKIVEKPTDFNINIISLSKVDLTMKKVSCFKTFKWLKNFYILDVG